MIKNPFKVIKEKDLQIKELEIALKDSKEAYELLLQASKDAYKDLSNEITQEEIQKVSAINSLKIIKCSLKDLESHPKDMSISLIKNMIDSTITILTGTDKNTQVK